jgi:23S rRNA (adenine2503-C2)-methyltransferase
MEKENFDYKVLESSGKNVWKYIFEKPDAIAESVLYKYDNFYERTVICCSVMSGCPVGCKFCGTGAQFIRNLQTDEIINQIETVLKDKNLNDDINDKCKKFQIMFMSMGEPLLNWENTKNAIYQLNKKYPNAQLLLSTVGIEDEEVLKDIIKTSKEIKNVGLQFSIHKSNNIDRDKLIPYQNKLSLEKISKFGRLWHKETGRKAFCNYCIDGTNNTDEDFDRLTKLFGAEDFNFTFSVVCSKNETMKNAGFRNLDKIKEFQDKFTILGYNTRTFDPAGKMILEVVAGNYGLSKNG